MPSPGVPALSNAAGWRRAGKVNRKRAELVAAGDSQVTPGNRGARASLAGLAAPAAVPPPARLRCLPEESGAAGVPQCMGCRRGGCAGLGKAGGCCLGGPPWSLLSGFVPTYGCAIPAVVVSWGGAGLHWDPSILQIVRGSSPLMGLH